jgi:hypothetical protein
MLVLVTGLPATGKSTMARKLAGKLKGVVLSTDRIRKRLVSRPEYTRGEKEMVYRVMILIAEYLLRSGVTVVLDGTFYLRSLRKQVYSLSSRTGSRLLIVECSCPEEVVRRRLKRRLRRKSLSDADYGVYKKIKNVYEPLLRKHISVDTRKALDQNIEEVITYLGS